MKVIRENGVIRVEEGDKTRVAVLKAFRNRFNVVLLRRGDAFFSVLYNHFAAATGRPPRVDERFEVVFTHTAQGVGRIPRGDISFSANFIHATVGVGMGPRGDVEFSVTFTHDTAGAGRPPRELLAFVADYQHEIKAAGSVPSFVVAFAGLFTHEALGVGRMPRTVLNFDADFSHAVKGVGVAPFDPNVFDTDYQAVLDYATAQGFTLPSGGQQIVGNTLVTALKLAGIWSKLYFLYMPATDGNQDFACINWKNPNNATNLIRVNSPLFDVNLGFKGTGLAHLEIPYNPVALSWVPTNFSIGGFDNENLAASASMLIGDSALILAETRVNVFPRNPSNQFAHRMTNGTVFFDGSITNSTGFMHLDRSNASSYQSIKNGATLGTVTAVDLGFFNGNFWSLRFANNYTTRRVAVLFAGQSLISEAAAFNTVITNYMSNL